MVYIKMPAYGLVCKPSETLPDVSDRPPRLSEALGKLATEIAIAKVAQVNRVDQD